MLRNMLAHMCSWYRSLGKDLYLVQIMLDKEHKAEPYIAYVRKLIREGFSGSVTVHLFEGGIRSLTKDSERVIPMRVKETVKMK